MSEYTACPICGEPKKRKWNLCHDCLEIYGGTADDWPEWLKSHMNSLRRTRYSGEQTNENEIPFNDFESYVDQYWSDIEVLNTRPQKETVIVTDAYGSVALPYAPYKGAEMNRQYRKSNGIPENIDSIDPDVLDAELVAVF